MRRLRNVPVDVRVASRVNTAWLIGVRERTFARQSLVTPPIHPELVASEVCTKTFAHALRYAPIVDPLVLEDLSKSVFHDSSVSF